MCRILFLPLMFGMLFASAGCRCGSRGGAYQPHYGPYNPYGGVCVEEDIWTTRGGGRKHRRGCRCGRSERRPRHDVCDCHGHQQHPVSGCACAAPVSIDCGCAAPVVSDCGCAADFPVQSGFPVQGALPGYEVGQPQIIYGEPIYGTPTPSYTSPPPSSVPPQAPPSADEYYVPPRSDDFESGQQGNAGHRSTTLPATLITPARL